jgi:hypothetical protein
MKLLQRLARQVIRAQVHGATPGRLVDSVAIPVTAGPQSDRRRHPCVEISTPIVAWSTDKHLGDAPAGGIARVEFPLRTLTSGGGTTFVIHSPRGRRSSIRVTFVLTTNRVGSGACPGRPARPGGPRGRGAAARCGGPRAAAAALRPRLGPRRATDRRPGGAVSGARGRMLAAPVTCTTGGSTPGRCG